jgi:iron complex outermembrane recepter protein
MISKMKKYIYLILLFVSLSSYAQTSIQNGSVTDNETKEPLAGATVSVKGKLIGTAAVSVVFDQLLSR